MVDSQEGIPRENSLNYSGGQTPAIWPSKFSSRIKIFAPKKHGKNRKDLIAGLALLGPSIPNKLAYFIADKEKQILESRGKKKNIHKLAKKKCDVYDRIIDGREDVKDPLKSSLISKKFIFHIKNEKDVFLTLKGAIIAIGFEFNDSEFIKFINNSANYHIVFAFFKLLLDNNIPISFIRKIFVDSICEGFISEKIPSDKNLEFYFINIGFLCGDSLWKHVVDARINQAKFLDPTRPEKKPLSNYKGTDEMITISDFIDIYTKLLPKIRGKTTVSNFSEFYGIDEKWRDKIIKRLYKSKYHPYPPFKNDSEEYHLLFYLLLNIDIAIHFGFGYTI
jgi:hypothetical protein